MIKKQYANQTRIIRHVRVRKTLAGTPVRPRLAVFRSSNEIYAQVIDDAQGRTIAAASSRDKDLANFTADALDTLATHEPTQGEAGAENGVAEEQGHTMPQAIKGLTANRRVRQAYQVGQLLAQRAKAVGVARVVFDRGGYIYHGRVAALAEGARAGGLDF